jgi:hypothetical protein
MFLAEFGERGLRLPCSSGEGTGLGDRDEIRIRCGGCRGRLGHI